MVHIGLGENSVVFKLGSSDGWAVVGDEDQLRLAGSQGSDGVLVSCILLEVGNYLPSLYFPDLMTRLSLVFRFYS